MRFFLFFLCLNAWAVPERLDLWFISPKQTGFVFKKKFLVTQNGWQKMGEGYFHPQFGYSDTPSVPPGEARELEDPKLLERKDFEAPGKKSDFLSSEEVNLIRCQKDYHFDLYCGKAKQGHGSSGAPIEIWIDTSSSLRSVDYAQGKSCYRRLFVEKLKNQCPGKSFDISVYDTSRKQVGSLDSVCVNYGLNDEKRLQGWVERSQAKWLIIITDISEFSVELTQFLDKFQANYSGHLPAQPIYADQLPDLVSQVSQRCRKI